MQFIKKHKMILARYLSPIVTFFAIGVFNINPLHFLVPLLGIYSDEVYAYVNAHELEFAFNSAVCVALSNIVIYLISAPIKVDMMIRNKKMKMNSTLSYPSDSGHRSKKLMILLAIDMKYKLLYQLFKKKIGLEIYYPSNIDVAVEGDVNLRGAIKNSGLPVDNGGLKKVEIDIFKAIPESSMESYSGEFFFEISIISTISQYSTDTIYVEIVPLVQNKYAKCILNFLLNLLIETEFEKHKIEITD